MDRVIDNAKRQKWLNIVNQCKERPTGISTHKWLTENGIAVKTYYYWLRKFREENINEDCKAFTASDETEIAFVEMSLPESYKEEPHSESSKSPIVIRKQDLTIEITNEISDRLLSSLIKEVVNA